MLIKTVDASVGRISARDVLLAKQTSQHTIHCLRTKNPGSAVKTMARQHGVNIKHYPVFNLLLDDIFKPFLTKREPAAAGPRPLT